MSTRCGSGDGGIYVTIDHGNGYVSKYLHCSEILVSVGDTVEKGDVIAKSGNTGDSTGPHLHFQIEYNDEAVDPLTFLYENGMGSGTSGIGSGDETEVETKTYAIVATWNSVEYSEETEDEDAEPWEDYSTYTITTTKVDYQNLTSGYTMPFNYLWEFLVITENKEFVLELAELVYNSEIEISIYDNETKVTEVETIEYEKYKHVVSEGSATFERPVTTSSNSNTTNSTNTSNSSTSGTSTQTTTETEPAEASADNNTDDLGLTETESHTYTTITTTNTLNVAVTLADVWMAKYVINITSNGTSSVGGTPQDGGDSTITLTIGENYYSELEEINENQIYADLVSQYPSSDRMVNFLRTNL